MGTLWKRALSTAIALALCGTAALPAFAADPLASGGFAEVMISAQATDIPQESLHLALYRRDAAGAFRQIDTLEDFITPVNRVTKDVQLHLTPKAEEVTLRVDYLTDLNGDGIYELLDDQQNPVNDVLTSGGSLASAVAGISTSLVSGSQYTLTADMLLERGEDEIAQRTTSGSASFLPELTVTNQAPESILYMVTVSYRSALDNADYELCYYLRLYDQLPAPSSADYWDIPEDAWYWDAVDYAVSRGYLSGTTRNQFAPNEPLTRAMLAQILYQVAGKPESSVSHYLDVPDTAWYYAAVSWASQTGVMDGSNSLAFDPDRSPARQELAVALYRFAQNAGLDTSPRADLSDYADATQVAPWARASVEWSVSMGLLAGYEADGSMYLSPSDFVTRAEFCAVLRTLCEQVLTQQ